MDYRKLSDFEINCKVAYHIGLSPVIMAENLKFDPCNNPEDAWSIILENGISLRKLHNGRWRSINEWGDSHQHNHENPLRAAMIVFLMMKEGE